MDISYDHAVNAPVSFEAQNPFQNMQNGPMPNSLVFYAPVILGVFVLTVSQARRYPAETIKGLFSRFQGFHYFRSQT
jgi:hypothetical protein